MLLVVASAVAGAQDEPAPVAAWNFNDRHRRLIRDVAGDRLHASTRADLAYVDSPGGAALVFDGHGAVSVTNDPALVMADTLTIDLWLRLDELPTTEPFCLVDKGGERYRLQVEASGRAMLGLKSGQERMDLSGGKLEPGRWHRLTGVFERPKASLYLDGQLVAEATWDHAVDSGGNLNLGSKGGVTYFFRGAMDELRIYRAARPPRESDAPATGVPGARAGEAKMEVETRPDESVAVDTGAVRCEIARHGAIRRLAVGELALVADNDAAPVTAEVFESADYDGWTDAAPGRFVAANPNAGAPRVEREAARTTVRVPLRLDFGTVDRLAVDLAYAFSSGSPFVTVSLAVRPTGPFKDRFLRSLGYRLPLALQRRKRVVQGGDRGVQWDTRHFYQFLFNPGSALLDEPDHNLWRHFVIDQNTAYDYHLWRSESPATAPLSMQRGAAAPGWIGAYDPRGGLLLAYRQPAARAPKSLWLEADGGGEAVAWLWSPNHPAFSLSSPQAAAVVGAPHRLDLLPFADDYRFAQPDVALAQHWGEPALASDGPPRGEVPAGQVKLWTAPAADTAAPPVSGGFPFGRSELREPGNVRLTHDGRGVPVQTRPLAFWPDGSIKWLLLTFAADGSGTGGAAGEQSATFDLTRRDGSAQVWRLDYGGGARPDAGGAAVKAAEAGSVVRIDTGPLQLELSTGQGWLRKVVADGREVLSAPARSFVDFLRPEQPYPCGTSLVQGRPDDGTLSVEKVELEESGPLRAVVRLEGMTGSVEPQRVIIRLEAYAGRRLARCFQSVEFLHQDPRAAFVRRMGMELPLRGMAAAAATVGGQSGEQPVAGTRRVGLRQHSHLGYTAWSQNRGERFPRIADSAHRSRGWLDVPAADGGVTVMLRDMWQQFPLELVADRDQGTLTAFFWPASAPPMDVRRYSNYPHRGQGESTSTHSDWVATSYYGNDPFKGVTRTHEVLWLFHGLEPAPAAIDAVNADFQRPPLVYAGAERYRATRVMLPEPLADPALCPRGAANLHNFARFWMFHQKLWGWYGLWDYGDVGHMFQTGYGWILAPDKLRGALAAGDGGKSLKQNDFVHDYHPNHDWALDNGRWGWSNTEGLLNLFMQGEYLRTGDRDVYFFVEAMARHNRDVDMRHDGKWLGYGTRHGVQHWSDGNHEERQTTHSEFRYHHYLSGDMRSRDFAKLLYDRVYTQRDVAIHAAHSGRMQGLLTQWEMTGSKETADILARYMPAFDTPAGLVESPAVAFPAVQRQAATRDLNAGNMFFWTFGAGHGMIEYYELTGNEAVRHALLQAADQALQLSSPGMRLKAVIFAARHAPDPAPYRHYLNDWLARGTSRNVVQMVTANERWFAGPGAVLRGNVPGSLFLMNDLPYLLTTLGADPPVADSLEAEIRAAEENGGPVQGQEPLSWQSQFDAPDLAEYFRIKHPQP